MPTPASLNDYAVESLSMIAEAKMLSKSYIDFGESTGFREEFEAIEKDFMNDCHSAYMRAFRLKKRIQFHERDLENAKKKDNSKSE